MTKNAKMKYKIESKFVNGLPRNPYKNGVGKPTAIVLHDTGNERSTLEGEISYMSRNWQAAFVHAWANGKRIVETANTDYMCWGGGPGINPYAIQIELVHEHDKFSFLESLDRWIFYAAYQCYWYGIKPTDATDDGVGTIWTHDAVSRFKGHTDHVDPMPYIMQRAKLYNITITWKMIFNKIVEYYNALLKGDSTKVLAIGEIVKNKLVKTTKKKKTTKTTVKAKKTTTAVKKGDTIHIVKAGDTIWGLSVKYDVSMDMIRKYNALKTDTLFVDQKVIVKKTSVTKPKPKPKVKQKTPVKVIGDGYLTKSQMTALLKTLPGKAIDIDNYPVGRILQCMDVAVWWALKLSDGKFRMWGNARDAIKNTLPKGWKLIENKPETLPQPGDIVVFSKGIYDNAWGHIGIVYGDITLQSFTVAEQNFDSKGSSPVKLRKDYYEGVSHFIRPALK